MDDVHHSTLKVPVLQKYADVRIPSDGSIARCKTDDYPVMLVGKRVPSYDIRLVTPLTNIALATEVLPAAQRSVLGASHGEGSPANVKNKTSRGSTHWIISSHSCSRGLTTILP